MRHLAIGLGALASLSACASTSPLTPGVARAVAVPESGVLPPPDQSDLYAGTRPYLIGPFDRLTIDVFGVPELSGKEVQTDAGGRVSFPLAGVIEAAGKTPAEIEQAIEERLRERYVRDPQVTVNLKEATSQTITVDGQVGQPGIYPVLGRMTLMRAVATARGATEFAKETEVVVFRTVKGQRMAALYDLKSIRGGYYEDPEIYPNDIVMVGDSPGRRLFKDALALIPLLTTPLIILLQN